MIDWNEAINYALIVGAVCALLMLVSFLLRHGVL